MTTISLELTVEQERALSLRAAECGFPSINDYLRVVVREQTADIAPDAMTTSAFVETSARLEACVQARLAAQSKSVRITPEFFDGLRKRLADRLAQMA